MVSRKHGLGVSITGKRGLHVFFRKKPSTFNVCIGEKMRGQSGSRSSIQSAFKSAVQSCK